MDIYSTQSIGDFVRSDIQFLPNVNFIFLDNELVYHASEGYVIYGCFMGGVVAAAAILGGRFRIEILPCRGFVQLQKKYYFWRLLCQNI